MKLTHINIQNFLGARAVEVQLTKPVTLFAGKNGAGKSSLQEAIRMALTGESVRVGLKKDYGQLITEGAESGFAEVEIDGTVRAFVTLPDGKTTPLTEYVPPTALPYVLDAQRFAKLEPNERRAFLFGLMGLSAGGDEVKKRLLEKGCNAQNVESIMPLLRSGFDAAHKEAQAKARDEKAAWRTVTGETYGEKKAASWAAEKPAFSQSEIDTLQKKLTDADYQLGIQNQRLGALNADRNSYNSIMQRIAGLREKANLLARRQEKLAHDETSLKEWEGKVDFTRQRAAGGRKVGLVHDLAFCLNESLRMVIPFGEMDDRQRASLADANAVLEKYSAEHGSIESAGAGDTEARNQLPEYEKSLQLMQRSVSNSQRDVAESSSAVSTILELESSLGDTAPSETVIKGVADKIADIELVKRELNKEIEALNKSKEAASNAEQRTAKAMSAHESVLAWIAIADALAPDGIPGEMLAEALGPINDRLSASSKDAEWRRVFIAPSMDIYDGDLDEVPRHYSLLSESEQWRADAMIAEAISHLSKINVLVLDRLDVLDLQGREDLIAWLDILAQEGEINTALIFGTLKALPANLPQTIAAHWLENGVVVEKLAN